MSKML